MDSAAVLEAAVVAGSRVVVTLTVVLDGASGDVEVVDVDSASGTVAGTRIVGSRRGEFGTPAIATPAPTHNTATAP